MFLEPWFCFPFFSQCIEQRKGSHGMGSQEQRWGIRIWALEPEIPSLQNPMLWVGWKTRAIIEAERLNLGTEPNKLMCGPGG